MTEEASADTARRGRPRPDDVVKRDEIVFGVLSDDHQTRDEIAEHKDLVALYPGTDEESTKTRRTRTYQSLVRLVRAGRVERVREGTTHRWLRVS